MNPAHHGADHTLDVPPEARCAWGTEDEASEEGDWAGAEAALDAVARRFPTAAVRPASLLGRREARADARRDAPRPGPGGPDRE